MKTDPKTKDYKKAFSVAVKFGTCTVLGGGNDLGSAIVELFKHAAWALRVGEGHERVTFEVFHHCAECLGSGFHTRTSVKCSGFHPRAPRRSVKCKECRGAGTIALVTSGSLGREDLASMKVEVREA